MSNDGFIKIYRSSSESVLYLSEPFTKWQAWCDLIMLAYFKDSVLYVRGIKVEAKRGCVYKSSEELAKRWQWSRGKVLRFLMYLETEQQIVQQKSNVITCISILHYDKYQSDGTTNGTADSTTKQKKEPKKNREEIIPPYNPPKGKDEYDWTILPEEFKPLVEQWLAYKKEKKQSYKPTGFKSFCKRLLQLSSSDINNARQIVETSMSNNYAGIFELKPSNATTQTHQHPRQSHDEHPTNDELLRQTAAYLAGRLRESGDSTPEVWHEERPPF